MIRTIKKLFWGWAIILSYIGYCIVFGLIVGLIEAGKKVVE